MLLTIARFILLFLFFFVLYANDAGLLFDSQLNLTCLSHVRRINVGVNDLLIPICVISISGSAPTAYIYSVD